jgi:hypothetical protein
MTRELSVTPADTHHVTIYMAGDIAQAEQVCREYCFKAGLCVTVTPTQYIYTGGQEAGFAVGLINYPRFPTDASALQIHAEHLGLQLMERLCQHSFTIESNRRTLWYSRRPQ